MDYSLEEHADRLEAVCDNLVEHTRKMREAIDESYRVFARIREQSSQPSSIHSSPPAPRQGVSRRKVARAHSTPKPVHLRQLSQGISSSGRGSSGRGSAERSEALPLHLVSSLDTRGESMESPLSFSSLILSRETVCMCRKESHGEMIACDNEKCPIEWYHLSCLGLRTAPAGPWVCPRCLPRTQSADVCICRRECTLTQIACANAACPTKQFHMRCLGLKSVPAAARKGTWLCPLCRD